MACISYACVQSNRPCKQGPHVLQDYATGSLQRNQALRAEQLRQLLTRLGASFVKVGQALSARPDLLPKPYLEVRARPA